MNKRWMLWLTALIFFIPLATVPVHAEVVNIPVLENITEEEIETWNHTSGSPSRLGNRTRSHLFETSHGTSLTDIMDSYPGNNGNGHLLNHNGSSSTVSINEPTLETPTVQINPITAPDVSVPNAPNYTAPQAPNYTPPTAPNVEINEAPDYTPPTQTQTADTAQVDHNARELGRVSSVATVDNVNDFRQTAQGQAEQMTQGLAGINPSTQYQRGIQNAAGGEDQVLDRIGHTITGLGGQIIYVLVMGLFYFSIIGAVWCGVRAIVAIFTKDSPLKWVGGAILSILIFVIIVSITGIDIQSTAIAEFINWIINGG